MIARLRRTKPYVCVDCDFADHFRFQATKDLDVAAGAWLRCLAHSRAQEQDGRVTLAWLRRNFGGCFERIEELATVGLLRVREDGDYELHAYAPRNQTRAMMDEDRRGARTRMRAARKGGSAEDAEAADVRTNTRTKRSTRANLRGVDPEKCSPEDDAHVASGAKVSRAASSLAPSSAASSGEGDATRIVSDLGEMTPLSEKMEEALSVTANKRACSVHPDGTNIAVTSALVPTSTSIYTSLSSSLSSPDLHNVSEIHGGHEGEAGEGAGGEAPSRRPLPPSERKVSGPAWLAAFSGGVAEHTGRPCTAGRLYLETLERIVAHHAPRRDAPGACAWLRLEAKAFARKWDGKHPPKGLTPDGLERWLNEGRPGPPEFGRPRIVQLPADRWHEDDFSDLGATVLK